MESMKKEGMETMMYVTHKHALVLREKEKSHETFCDVCRRIIVGSAYDCEQRKCDFSIHRSCAKFPQQIQHPFHPQHPLTFLASPPPDDDSKKSDCSACGMIGWVFIYHCYDCQFSLDVACAALTPTTDHQDQSDPDQDHEDDHKEFYCSVCEEKRDLSDPSYYCAECHYIAHFHCVFSEVIHLLKEERSLAWENGGTELDTPINVVKEDTDEMVRDVSSSSLVELDHEEIEKLPPKEETEIEELHREVEVEETKLEALKTEVEEQEAKVTVLKTKFKALEVKYEQR
ncbi:hypothetical protein F0562_011690 [Nyssa sinensis]|uniref:DC1 domain-containing protein n=1 Tax=Nyssa sinensis TaxID=561372 RepID=A0A5J4ZUE7_9ASTE|nr:hypothetical protein F0562_011690 [Nyssa sinensis]